MQSSKRPFLSSVDATERTLRRSKTALGTMPERTCRAVTTTTLSSIVAPAIKRGDDVTHVPLQRDVLSVCSRSDRQVFVFEAIGE